MGALAAAVGLEIDLRSIVKAGGGAHDACHWTTDRLEWVHLEVRRVFRLDLANTQNHMAVVRSSSEERPNGEGLET